MNCLIIDDERLARQEMRRLLAVHPRIQILGEAANGREARKAIAEFQPDVIFLDVVMPGQTGFELIETLPEPIPLVVFVTAFDHHAAHAFDIQALDYLVKPVEPARLESCISRLELVLDVSIEPAVADAPEPVGAVLTADDSVLLREGDRLALIKVDDISLLESERNYTRIHFSNGTLMILRSLNALEGRLPPTVFFRTSRAQMINIRHITQMQTWFSQSIKVKLRNGLEVEFSRRQALAFREQMGL